MSAADHAQTLSPEALYCRAHTHGPWRPYTVDDTDPGEIVVVEVCDNCGCQSRYSLDRAGRYSTGRWMVSYAPGYRQPAGSGYLTALDRGSYRLAWLATLRKVPQAR